MKSPRTRTAGRVWGAAAGLAMAACCFAQTSSASLEAELAETRARLTAPGLREGARFQLVKRCDELEQKLITEAAGDDRLTTWLADRAAWSLELAGEDGADAAALYGLPTLAQQRAVHSRAQEALDQLAQADGAAATAVARLETELVKLGGSEQGRVRAAVIESTLTLLLDAEQGDRIPRLRTMARVLLGASGHDPADRESLQAAVKDLLARPPAGDAQAVALGTALLHTARGTTERVDDVLDAAATQLKPVARKYLPGDDAQAAVSLRALLGLLRAGREAPARTRSDNTDRERAIDLMEAEAKSAAMFERAAREQSARTLLLGSAIRTLMDAVKAVGADEAVRVRMYDKLAAALPAGVALDRLPAEATLARAIARVREAGMKDPLAREDASALLAALADRADASPELRSQARWERAVIAGASQDPVAEVDAVAAIVRADPETDRGLAAARRAFDLFARQEGTAGPAGFDEKWRVRLPALRDALALLARRDVAGGARWKSETIRLSITELGTADGAQAFEAVERALSLLEAGAGTAAESGALSAALWRNMDARAGAVATRARALGDSAAVKDWEALLPQARRASVWAQKGDAERAALYGMLLGEALVGADNSEALAALAPLAGTSVDQSSSPQFVRYRMALGRAQRRAGESARAIATFRDVADRLEGAPGSASPEATYWAAWSEMLAIMQSENKDGARSGDIRVQIKRLELMDAKLGGSPYVDRIRQIQAAVGE